MRVKTAVRVRVRLFVVMVKHYANECPHLDRSTRLCVCVGEVIKTQRLDEVNHKWSQWSKAGAGRTKDMCHHAQEVFCYAVWLCKSGCWCFQVQGRMGTGPVQACKRTYPIASPGNGGPSPGGQKRGFSLTLVRD